MTALRVDVVATDAALAALEPEWHALWGRVPGATPFLSPAWLLPWWQVFGTGRPVVATLRQDGRLDGLLPLYRLDEGPCRKLLPIGIGLSDYFDVLVAPGVPGDAMDQLLDAALRAGIAAGAQTCDFAELPPGSPLRHAAAPGVAARHGPGETCPILAIGAATDAEAAVPARQRRKLRMNRHRAERLGGWSLEYATVDTAGAMLDTLLRLNADRWAAPDPAAARFHRLAIPALCTAGLLRLAQLRIGGDAAACCYALRDGAARLMFYMIGFDPRFAACSPGTVLIGGMIDDAIAQGCRDVHFLRGNEAYKYAWGARDQHNAVCHLPLAPSNAV